MLLQLSLCTLRKNNFPMRNIAASWIEEEINAELKIRIRCEPVRNIFSARISGVECNINVDYYCHCYFSSIYFSILCATSNWFQPSVRVQLELGNGNAAPIDLPSEMGSFYWHSMRHLRHHYIATYQQWKLNWAELRCGDCDAIATRLRRMREVHRTHGNNKSYFNYFFAGFSYWLHMVDLYQTKLNIEQRRN